MGNCFPIHTRIALICAPFALLAMRCQNTALPQRPDIRVDVTLIRVPFVALDPYGASVTDLHTKDIAVSDNGYREEVKYLWKEDDLPLSMALLVDISSSQEGLVGRHREAVQRFVGRIIGPKDQVELITLDEQPRLLVKWTSSISEVLEAAERIRQQRHAGTRFGEPCLPPPRFKRGGCGGTAIWDGVFHVARSMPDGAPGRKAILLLSDGLDLSASVHGLSSAIEACQSAGVTVYTIRYLSAPYLALSPLTIRRALHDQGMQRIARETGGLAFEHPKALDAIFDRIESDLRSQYVLAYQPKEASVSGSWHRLNIGTVRTYEQE